ncbi:MAG: TonB-dependent receptor [Alphaproteobacteria bacterium]|nr:MAG: TonB-dependent receptor [Alphaproteobacteria bacterium]
MSGFVAKIKSTTAIVTMIIGSGVPLVYAADEDFTLEEITVTAQKRSQNLQDVAMGITAFSGLEMERAGDIAFEDFAVRVPNLSFGTTGDGGIRTRSIAIRGIFGTGTTGFYIDDTPMEESMSPLVLDLERVEVLRGPQGTLYGARSMGGTVRFITKQPDLDQMEVKGRLGTSNTKEGGWNYMVDAVVNLPIVEDKVAVRVLGYFQHEEGVFDRVHSDYTPSPGETFATQDFTTRENVDDFDVKGIQAAIKIAASDRLTINGRVNYQNAEIDSLPFADNEPGNFINARAFDVDESAQDEWVHASLGFTIDLDMGSLVGNFSHWNREVNDSEDVSELTSWLIGLAGLEGFLPPQAGTFDKTSKNNGEVAELRFVSEFDGSFQVVVGGFYSNTKTLTDYISIVPGTSDAIDAFFGAPAGTDVFGFADTLFTQDGDRTIKEIALFGEASYEVTEDLKLTAGLRWFETTIDSSLIIGGFAGGPPSIGDAKENGINPKFSAEYSYSDDILLYASAAKGFRRGGVNGLPVEFCTDALVDVGVSPEEAGQVNSDTLWSYEVGVKSTLAEGRAQVNAAAYWIDWNNLQQSFVLDCGFGTTLNTGGARSRGFEIEASLAVTENLVVDAAVGYTDAVVTSQGEINTPISQPGTPIQHVPTWTLSTSAEYSFTFSDDIEGLLRLDYSYIGDSVSYTNNGPGSTAVSAQRESLSLLNLRATAIWENWEISVFGNNLFNDISSYGDNRSLALETPGRPRISQNRTRTIGIETRFRF